MSRYALTAVIATIALGLAAVLAAGALRSFNANLYPFYDLLERQRALEPPPLLSPPTIDEQAACRAQTRYPPRLVKRYFAKGISDPEIQGNVGRWYSNKLCMLGEPVLAVSNSRSSRYRFLWLRAFDSEVSIRVDISGEDATLYAVQAASRDGSMPEIRIERALERFEVDRLVNILEEVDFWNLKISKRVYGLDGSRWLIEASQPDRYHLVSRFMGDELKEAGEQFLLISGLNPRDVY